MEWFLNTVGTELISAIIGCFIGSGITYKIMYNKYIKTTTINQKQKTGNGENNVSENCDACLFCSSLPDAQGYPDL